MNYRFIKKQLKKKTLAQNKSDGYNDVRMSVQVKMTEGKEVKYV